MTRSLIALTLLAGCAGCDPRTPASGGVLDQASVHVFTSGADGFHTNTWFVDTGTEVIVVDAQFTPDVAEQALAYLRTVTQAPVTYVVATHPNPDKFGGAAVFQAEGATFVTSRATAASMPDVHAYKQAYFEGLGAFEPGTYPDMPQVDQTFDGSLTLDITGDGSVELFELSNGGVTTNQTVVRVNGQDLIVGDLVAVDTHAWLEGGIVDGAPAPNLMAWKRALAELSGMGTGQVFPGRGMPTSVTRAVQAQTLYLDELDDITEEVMALHDPGDEAWQAIADEAVRAFPGYAHSYLINYGVYGLGLHHAR